ncbi:hypothetical protein V8G54_006480 [Vigna mungo]|uniref:Uncharacterized protein n=1 Tax=Vigna mungo TaxID=3915 RepID=A0AAQ3S7C8_VIGMU
MNREGESERDESKSSSKKSDSVMTNPDQPSSFDPTRTDPETMNLSRSLFVPLAPTITPRLRQNPKEPNQRQKRRRIRKLPPCAAKSERREETSVTVTHTASQEGCSPTRTAKEKRKGKFSLLTTLSRTKKEEKWEEKSPLARRRPYGSTDNHNRRRERHLSRASTTPVILAATRPSSIHKMEKSKTKKKKKTLIFEASLKDNPNL